MLDAVLFDLDGTLTDPAVGIVASFRHALSAVGHPVGADVDLRWMIGPPLQENFAVHGLPDHLHDDAIAAFRDRHISVGLFEATLVPGMVEVLDGLVAEGVPLGLATAKPLPQAVTTLEHFEIRDRFKAIGAAHSDGVPMPKAEIVADALGQLGLFPAHLDRASGGAADRASDPASGGARPPRVAMVGDRMHDVHGGRHNGCVTVSVGWGYAPDGELEAVDPDHVVDTPADLAAVLAELNRPRQA